MITCDAALATALNAMVSTDKLGGFAYTPRLLAGSIATSILREKTLTDLEVVESIERDTNYEFGFIHSEVQKIRDIRRHTADVRKYLRSNRSREIYDYYSQLPTIDKAMENYDPTVYRIFPQGETIAVIGMELFDDLDKHFIPVEYTEIDPFTDGDYEIDTIYAIGNDRQIASSIVDLIDVEKSLDTAVVLDSSASIADALRSAFYRKKIPFKNSLDVKDLSQVRDFLQFISLALDYPTLRVYDVRELFSTYQIGGNPNKGRMLDPKFDRYLLSRVPLGENVDPSTQRLIETMRDIGQMTFSEAAEKLFQSMPQKTSVLILLDTLGLSQKTVSRKLADRILYAVNNLSDLKHNEQVPENERKGVLIADCKNSVYVDRPFVIYIGLDDSWEPSVSGKDYIDKEAAAENNALRTEILLQQGTSRIYAVKPVTKGKETLPCPSFQTILDNSKKKGVADSFEKICKNFIRGSWAVEPAPKQVFGGTFGESSGGDDWKFSKTTYNAYSDCPVKFVFSKLIRTEDSDSIVFGNCLHEFAEFYFCYPELVKKRGLDYYLTHLEDMFSGLSSECHRELDDSKFRVYLNNLVRYIDLVRPDNVPLDAKLSARKYQNQFMLEEGVEYSSTYVESELPSIYPIFAKYDLSFGDIIVDFKTGKVKKPDDIISGFSRKHNVLADFQALIYLQTLYEKTQADCEFRLLYIGDNYLRSVDPSFDIRENVRKVALSCRSGPEVLMERGGPVFNYYQDKKSYQTLVDNWDEFSDIVIQYLDESYDLSPTDRSDICAEVSFKLKPKEIDAVAKKIHDTAEKKYYKVSDADVVVPLESMNEFLEKLTKDHTEAKKAMLIPVLNLKKGNTECNNKCAYYRACVKAELEEDDE